MVAAAASQGKRHVGSSKKRIKRAPRFQLDLGVDALQCLRQFLVIFLFFKRHNFNISSAVHY